MQVTSTTAPDDIVTRVRGDEAPTPITTTPADSGDDDDDSTDTHVAVDASTAERATAVVQDGRISLDAKLSIFTVMGTTEPRVVKLFPRETCSCPATASCYHIVAARRAVGIIGNDKRRVINLTQLRRNKRKRADKTGGRKRPRAADVDVVPAPDADVEPGAALLQSQSQQPDSPRPSTAINTDICHACDMVEPPPRKNSKRRGAVNWLKCDACPRWYHTSCVGVRNTAAPYECDMCCS